MINIETKLTGNIESDLERFGTKIKESVLFSGVAAMANVVYQEVLLNAGRHVKTGTLRDNVYRAYIPDKSTDAQKVYYVSVRKGKAPHWHFLEYGTSRQAATPFIRPAFDRVDDAIKAGKERMAERLKEL